MTRILAFLILTASCWPASTVANPPDRADFVGFLEIRSHDGVTDAISLKTPLELRLEPTMSARSLGAIKNIAAAETFEWSYESIGIGVYGYTHDGDNAWYRIYIPEKRQYAWIVGRDGFVFRGLSQLVTDSLSYMTRNWDRLVYSDPTVPGSATALETADDEVAIEIASSTRIGGRIWLLVVVLEESPCTSAEAPAVLGSGWVPALSEKGLLNVWFYSRGC